MMTSFDEFVSPYMLLPIVPDCQHEVPGKAGFFLTDVWRTVVSLQCKGGQVPHNFPKSIACCDKPNLCNKNLKPAIIYRTTTTRPPGTWSYLLLCK